MSFSTSMFVSVHLNENYNMELLDKHRALCIFSSLRLGGRYVFGLAEKGLKRDVSSEVLP